ncbi:putative lipoprotein [Enhygromyxa salina]|uniref:Putative lipoprotein n=1 Tax=Enhygromyxa salina TaxID=215803 RepID=A0A0C2CKM7_9BACT|nr:ferritin-like domain-containing protein [Enhygromyxa salina]KIG11756.1 putative lipoprotein [Enhygromyxa salina]
MDVRHALLAVLSTVPLANCHISSGEECILPAEDFEIDESLTPAQIEALVEEYGADCEAACSEAYARTVGGWEPTSIDTCDLYLPPDSDQDGHISCTGLGVEIVCTEGRRPLGHVEAGDDRCTSALGRRLAAMAYLEAASVDAFEQLAAALEGWGAPAQLVARCHAAAADEGNHARWLTALAVAHGGCVPTPTRLHDAPMTLFALAEQNASEGCVYETFAALIANVRARRAQDPRLRRVYARVAADETRHAQLAWDLDAWFRGQLDAGAAARVEAARDDALAQLAARAWGVAQLPAELGTLHVDEAARLAGALGARLAA